MRHVANREKAGDRGRILMLILPATRRVMLACQPDRRANFGRILAKARLSPLALNS